jgi:hypothetical protein
MAVETPTIPPPITNMSSDAVTPISCYVPETGSTMSPERNTGNKKPRHKDRGFFFFILTDQAE